MLTCHVILGIALLSPWHYVHFIFILVFISRKNYTLLQSNQSLRSRKCHKKLIQMFTCKYATQKRFWAKLQNTCFTSNKIRFQKMYFHLLRKWEKKL